MGMKPPLLRIEIYNSSTETVWKHSMEELKRHISSVWFISHFLRHKNFSIIIQKGATPFRLHQTTWITSQGKSITDMLFPSLFAFELHFSILHLNSAWWKLLTFKCKLSKNSFLALTGFGILASSPPDTRELRGQIRHRTATTPAWQDLKAKEGIFFF